METTKTYAELLKEVSVTITPNEAAFLARLLNKYMSETPNTNGLEDLANRLSIKAGC